MSTILNDTVTPTTNENHIHVKLQFNDEFRRFFIPSSISSLKFIDLESKIKALLHLTDKDDISIKYKDEENEWITISSDVELETGLLIAGNAILRLLCTLKSENPNGSIPQQDSETNSDVEPRHWKRYQNRENNGPYRGKDRKWKKNYHQEKFQVRDKQNEDVTENNEMNDDNDNGGKRWKEQRKYQKKNEKRERKSQKGERKRKNHRDEKEDESGTSSESNSDVALLSLEEIKVELSKMKEEESILKEKARDSKKNFKEMKNMIQEKRKDEKTQPDEILNLREELNVKKKAKKSIQEQLRNTRSRMNKLREAAETKQV